VNPRHWFLPEEPDVLGLLGDQLSVTTEGVEVFAQWAAGETYSAADLREIEARGDLAKRDLLNALQTAFVTPLEPEDLFTLSRSIDWILNAVSDLVGESEVLECEPDAGIAEIARLLVGAVHEIEAAISELGSSGERATAAADRAIGEARRMQQAYYRGMAETLERPGRSERIALRELYRRCGRIGETVVDVAERVIYSVVKES
jgi:uncharacterized protein Yka (UPF0111/DUF47 family)